MLLCYSILIFDYWKFVKFDAENLNSCDIVTFFIHAIEISFGVFESQFLQLHLDSASGNTLPASGNGSITQNLRVTNSLHGKVHELCFL